MNKPKRGGLRNPPGGRPKNKYPLRIIKIACTDEEYQEIIKALNTRHRALGLLRVIRGGQQNE